MKKMFLSLVTAVFAFTALTQETLQVDITKLSPRQLEVYQQIKQAQSEDTLSMVSITPEKVDKYAQVGRGIGVAINEGLGAVTKNVEQFSQTSAGKWLMVIITWKVMGQDAIGLTRSVIQWIIGGCLLVVGIPFWIWLVKRNCVNAPIATIEKIGFWSRRVTYKDRTDPIHADWIVAYGLCFAVYLGVTAAITFIH